MNIALIAHDAKKELMVQFCTAYSAILSKHTLCATGITGRLVEESAKLKLTKFLSGSQGGVQQITSQISCNEVDILFFFRDPLSSKEYERHDDINILRICDMHTVPLATNIATGEALILALERGDLDWREIDRENEKSIF